MLRVSAPRRAAAPLACIVLFGVIGCGGTGRIALSGTVTYNGEPIDNGTIGFVSNTSGAAGGTASATITDGKYAFDSEHGPPPGKYKVEIYWNKKTGRKVGTPGDPGVKMDEVRQILPPRFNKKTELTADVSASTLNFELTGDPLKKK